MREIKFYGKRVDNDEVASRCIIATQMFYASKENGRIICKCLEENYLNARGMTESENFAN